MKYTENIERLIKNFCAIRKSAVKTTTELDGKIIDDAVLAQKTSKTVQSAAVQPNIWRIIMRSRMTQYAAAAVIILVIIIGIVELGKPIGASAAFAAAMNNIKQARTFSCTGIFEVQYEDGDNRGKYLLKQKWMFKEPDRERHETLTSAPPWPKDVGEVTIWHYGKRQQLQFRPFDKTAKFHDMSSDYDVDDKTGELRLTQLSTRLRDRLLKLSAGAVEDLGRVELEGQSVRMLRSRKDKRITTVWVNPGTSYPVQIEHKWTDQSRSPVMYTSIQIDTELDDALFSLEPPEGYTVKVHESAWPGDKEKIGAKIWHMGKLCLIYANQHNDQFPGELADLVRAGIITDEVLKKVLASPDEPDGPPVFRYRQPDTSVADWSIEVMLYEVYEKGSGDDQVVVTLLDSHSELVPVKVLEQYLKPWPANKKRVSACMVYLYEYCDRYAKEHEDQYPSELADLAREDLSVETIQRLRSAWGQRDGRDAILYRLPDTEADPSTEVMFCEIYDQWPDGGAVVCYTNGRCEMIPDQNRFEELIR